MVKLFDPILEKKCLIYAVLNVFVVRKDFLFGFSIQSGWQLKIHIENCISKAFKWSILDMFCIRF
jgi:hypothetical protein